MRHPFHQRISQIANALELREKMKTAGVADNPYYNDLWEWGLSPLGNGKHGARFQARLDDALTLHIFSEQLKAGGRPVIPSVPADRAILLGHELGTGRPVVCDIDVLNRHLLVIGSSGSGKTTLLCWIAYQALTKNL